jgi:hypothetical protein
MQLPRLRAHVLLSPVYDMTIVRKGQFAIKKITLHNLSLALEDMEYLSPWRALPVDP